MASGGIARAHVNYLSELCRDMSLALPKMDVHRGNVEFPNGDFQYNAHVQIPEIGYEHTHLIRSNNEKEAMDTAVIFAVELLEKNRKAVAHKLMLNDRADVFVFCDEDSHLLREIAHNWPNVMFCLFNVQNPEPEKLCKNVLESTGNDLVMATRLTTVSSERPVIVVSNNSLAFTLSHVMENFYWMTLDHLGNYMTALDKLLMKVIVYK